MTLRGLRLFLLGTLRGRLILSVAAVHAVMMTLFILDLTVRQQALLLDNQVQEAVSMSQSLATSSAVWIAAHDLSGLQELVKAERRYPEMLFTVLTDERGRVLAHTDPSKLGLYLLDLPSDPQQTVFSQSAALVDVAVPALLDNRLVGWVRVGLGQKAASEKLAAITFIGILYALAAIAIGSLIAWQMGRRITQRLYAVQDTMGEIRKGLRTARANLSGMDEAAVIARDFNSMLDALDERDRALLQSEGKYGQLLQNIHVAVVVHDPDTRILMSNPMAQKLLGLTEDQLVGKTTIDPAWHFLREDGTVMPSEEYPANQVFATRQPLKDLVVGVHRPDLSEAVWVLVNADAMPGKENDIPQVIVTFIDITERKQAEAALRKNEAELRAFFSQSIDGCFYMMLDEPLRWDETVDKEQALDFAFAHQRLTQINDAMLAQYGATREAMLNLTPNDFFEHNLEYGRDLWRRFFDAGMLRLESDERKLDGTPMWIEGEYIALYDAQGQILGHFGIQRDVTERKRTEQALHEQEQHSQSLLRLSRKLEQAQTYADVLDAAQDEVREVIGYQNLWAYLITEDKKYAHAFFAGEPFEKTIMSEDGTATLTIQGDKMLEEIAEATEIVVVEDAQTDERVNKEIVTKLGNRTIVNVPIILFDRHLGSVGMGTFGDEGVLVPTTSEQEYLKALASHLAVTLDRIHLLTKRQQMEQELAAREQEYRILLENIPDLIVRYDTNLRRIYVNPAWEKASGLSAAEVVNVPPAVLPKVPAPTNAEYLEKLQRVLATGTTQSIEFTWVNAYGVTLFLEYVIVPEYDPHGKISGVLSVGRDITERKRNERELIILNHAINQSSDAVFLINEQLIFAYVNDAACHSLGYTREELLTMGPSDIDADITYDAAGNFLNSQFADGYYPRFETRHKTRAGHTFPVEISSSIVEYDGAKFSLTTVRDITERKRVEDALVFVAQHGWQAGGENFFDALAQFLGEKLNMDYVLIDRIDENPDIAETVALYAKGAITPNMRYALKGTPCENVMGRRLCIYPHSIQQLFPEDTLLSGMGAESYIGIPLWDSTGQPIGLIAVIGNKPLPDDAPVTQLLQLVATRAAAELERERSDRLLRTREHEFRTLAANLPDNIIRHDREGRVVYVNPVLEETLGADAAQMMGMRIREMYPDGSYEAGAQAVDAALASGENGEIELTVPVPGKGPIVHQIRTIVERDDQGEVSGVLSIGRDITERKRAEEELRASEEKFRALIEQSAEGVALIDETGCIVEWNQANEMMTGMTRAEAIGLPLWELAMLTMAPERQTAQRRDRFKTQVLEALRTGQSPLFTHSVEAEFHPRGGGEKHYLHQTIFPIKTATGFRIASLTHDITERKHAEAEIQALAKFPGENPNPVLRVTHEGVLLYSNPAGADLIQEWKCSVGNRLPDSWCALVREALHQGSPREIETICGARLFVLTLAPIMESGYVNLYGNDITDRKQAEEKIKRHLDELERWYNVTLNREERIRELKREVNLLLIQRGEPARYANQD